MDRADVGALVVGGQHPGLGIVRSLGRRGIPVYVLDDRPSVACFSRHTRRVVRVKDLRDDGKAVDAVLDAGRKFGLKNWVLFPTRDETVAAFSHRRSVLAEFFRVTTQDWNTVQWALDKKKTYELAANLGIPCPRTFAPRDAQDLEDLGGHLPLALKPAVKPDFFYGTGAKAWRANTLEELRDQYSKALQQIRSTEILIQEIIPGGGACQLSYCAFFRDGKAHSTLVARRERQHPPEFGRAATYVETVDAPAIEALAIRFLKAIDYYGLVEIEFKQDPRDGHYKLLDVNARTWGFHALGHAAGVDFPYLLFADQVGLPLTPSRGKAGIGWLRMVTDVPTALADLVSRRLSLSWYLKSLQNTRVESVFSREDPLPSVAELALLPYLAFKKYY